MTEKFKIFFSNRLEILYENLKKKLFRSDFPFARRLVVVYGPAMKSWLMLRMAKDEELQVGMGIEVVYLNEIFEKLLSISQPHRSCAMPSHLELSLAIEQEMIKTLKKFQFLGEKEQNEWMPLIQYLKLDPGSLFKLSHKAERRLIGLSQQIAKCFRDYGRYANGLIPLWEKHAYPEWQCHLWKALFGGKNHWIYPCKAFQQPLDLPENLEIHFFSISFVAKSEFYFLSRISQEKPVYYYLLSPCSVFWSDIRSDKESVYLQSFWQQRLGAQSSQLNHLEEFLRDRNPLLANFGRLGREMACQIEESAAQTHACYALPDHVWQLDEELVMNDDLVLTKTDRPMTLLHAVQADILLMRNPQGKPPIPLDTSDFSIQLHIASTKRREIQILYHNLLHLIEKETDLYASDILVMAPDMMDYAPYIQSIFGSAGSLLDFQILDLGLQAQSELIQGFLQLLALSESRWSAVHLLQLFEHRSFQRRHQLTSSDYAAIQHWIETTGIHWGETWQHRNEVLQRRHCLQDIVEESNIGTWEYGISRLLMGLATVVEADSANRDPPPYENIDFSQAELLGKWIRILHALRDDLSPLHDQTRMTIEDWVNYLLCLLESYFRANFEEAESTRQYEDLKAELEVLRFSAKGCRESPFSFQSIKVHLHTLLQQKAIIYQENRLKAIRFCSMMPLRSIPARAIALIGMQEGDFPRHNPHSSLNLIIGRRDSDYCPTAIDYDRYLFLEALHCAQDYLLISYQGYCYTDGKQLQPSIIVEELFSYLDKYYSIQNEKVSASCIYRHPFDSFHEAYFQKNSLFFNYSFKDYQAAQAFYKEQKKPPHCFVRDFVLDDQPQRSIIAHRSFIDIKHLSAIARNPIKFHLNHVLEIYLQTEEDRQIKIEEDLVLSSLDKYQLKHSSLKEPVDRLLLRAEKEGRLPFGLFKTVAVDRLKDEIKELKDHLKKHRIVEEEIFNIEFCVGCQRPVKIDDINWQFPALPLHYEEGYEIYLTGKLSHVTPQGLLSVSKGTLADAWKMWAPFLAFLYAAKLHPQPLEKQLILLQAAQPKKAFVDDPEPYLKQFVHYYSLCLKNFSPLMPDWIPLILDGNAKGLRDKMRQAFSSPFGSDYQSLDLKWILNRDCLPNTEKMIHYWKPQAEILLGDLIRHWYVKAVGDG